MRRPALVFGAFASLAAGAALLVALEQRAAIDVRALPHQTQFGRIFPGHPVGAQFVSASGGLHALDIALVALGPAPTPLELSLREAPGGELLKQVVIGAEQLPSGDGWVRVELGLAADGRAPRSFHFELASAEVSSHSPWVRYRAVPHVVRPWGERVIAGETLECELNLLPHDELCALALAVDGLDAAAAPAVVRIVDPRSGALAARGEVLQRSPQATAWSLFTFEPLANARHKPWSLRFELPPGARVIADERGPSLIAFHGRGVVDPALGGMSCGAQRFTDRDLIFRAWTEPPGASPLGAELSAWRERGGARLACAALAFVLSAALLGAWIARGDERR